MLNLFSSIKNTAMIFIITFIVINSINTFATTPASTDSIIDESSLKTVDRLLAAPILVFTQAKSGDDHRVGETLGPDVVVVPLIVDDSYDDVLDDPHGISAPEDQTKQPQTASPTSETVIGLFSGYLNMMANANQTAGQPLAGQAGDDKQDTAWQDGDIDVTATVYVPMSLEAFINHVEESDGLPPQELLRALRASFSQDQN